MDIDPKQFSLEEVLKPQNCALLVVDMQNRFCHPREKFAKEGKDIRLMQAVAPHIEKLITAARSKNIPVIFTKIYDDPKKLSAPGERRYLKWVEMKEDPKVGPVENTFGAQFYKLTPKPQDTVIIKYDWSAFTGKDSTGRSLETILKDNNITTLVVTGVKTEVCVGTTVRDAYMRGYFVVVPKEAVGSDKLKLHEANLANFDPIYADVVSKSKVAEIWSKSS